MMLKNQAIKTVLIEAALPSVPFDGWTLSTLESAALDCGYSKSIVRAVFPSGVKDAVIYFSHWADEKMIERLKQVNQTDMRVRDRISLAVKTRIDILLPHKEAERLAVAYWMRPMRKFEGIKLVWKTADRIWKWAGDESSDYNHYTKRGLLSGVITATTFFWLNEKASNMNEVTGFLNRRIDNAMSVGKITSRFKKV